MDSIKTSRVGPSKEYGRTASILEKDQGGGWIFLKSLEATRGVNLEKKIQACFFPLLNKRLIWVFGHHRG
jgi:hypothetical protein